MQIGCGAVVTHTACTHCLAPSVLRIEKVCSNVPYYTYKVSVKMPPQAAHTHFRYARRQVGAKLVGSSSNMQAMQLLIIASLPVVRLRRQRNSFNQQRDLTEGQSFRSQLLPLVKVRSLCQLKESLSVADRMQTFSWSLNGPPASKFMEGKHFKYLYGN